MKFYLIAGEASGDLHGSNLMKELKQLFPDPDFRYWGGDLMEQEGGTLVRHYKDHDFMGIVEVVKNIRTIFGNIKYCKQDIEQYMPDAIVFIDFPGFNLRIVEFAKRLGIKTFYYISPTVWAWKEKRALKIKQFVDHMFVVLPFVKDFYQRKFEYHVDYVGHPLVDSINQKPTTVSLKEFQKKNGLPEKSMVAVLPGSRTQEIRENLQVMQEFTDEYPNHTFVIAGMKWFSEEFYRKFITSKNIGIVFDQTYDLLRLSDAAIVVSGSATLETAIIGTPEMLVYKTSPITYHIFKRLISKDIKFLGLPNLIMGKEIIPELIQKELNAQNVNKTLNTLLYDTELRNKMISDFQELNTKLGGGTASRNVAEHIFTYLAQSSQKS